MSKGDVTREDDRELFSDVLGDGVGALEEAEVPYAIFGSIASLVYGRPGPTGDIDVLVTPQEAGRALEALGRAGFETDRADPNWIYKATKDGVLLDVIFRVKGDLYLDDDVAEHTRTVEFEGRKIRLVAPEDALIIEAVSAEAQAAMHWFNALGILAKTELDWEYLERRARFAGRRISSLLIYGDSTDLSVPRDVIARLFRTVYGE